MTRDNCVCLPEGLTMSFSNPVDDALQLVHNLDFKTYLPGEILYSRHTATGRWK